MREDAVAVSVTFRELTERRNLFLALSDLSSDQQHFAVLLLPLRPIILARCASKESWKMIVQLR